MAPITKRRDIKIQFSKKLELGGIQREFNGGVMGEVEYVGLEVSVFLNAFPSGKS